MIRSSTLHRAAAHALIAQLGRLTPALQVMTDIAAVVAAGSSRGIGIKGTLPWRLPGDMAQNNLKN
jgi:hypothetical protein